jgi:hypothetical protein
MKIKILLASFVGLAVGLFVGLVVGAVGAWMLAAHFNGNVFANLPLPAEIDQADAALNTPWSSSEVAAADSVEGQLRAQGKRWVQTTGEITERACVQDILEGRLGQPEGRGKRMNRPTAPSRWGWGHSRSG